MPEGLPTEENPDFDDEEDRSLSRAARFCIEFLIGACIATAVLALVCLLFAKAFWRGR